MGKILLQAGRTRHRTTANQISVSGVVQSAVRVEIFYLKRAHFLAIHLIWPQGAILNQILRNLCGFYEGGKIIQEEGKIGQVIDFT